MELERLERFIMDKMMKTRIPGLSVALIKDGEVVYARGFGFRDAEKGLPATPTTLYGIGSVTKSFTALAIMQLAEEGKLDIEDPVEKYVPLRIKPRGREIKIWHLMTHSSGIPALGYAEAYIRGLVGDEAPWMPAASWEDILTFMSEAEEWVESPPGERFFYLNEGYVLLGRIIEVASGLKYEEYVKRRILEPLKMGRTMFGPDAEKDPEWAVPYVLDREGRRIRSRFPFGVTADGGLISTVLDLARYLMMYMNRGELEGARLLSKEGIETMEKPWVKLPYELLGAEAYGLGWLITPNFLGYRMVGHGGSVLVHTAYVAYIPEAKVGVALLANASGYPLSYIGMYALALLLGRDPEEVELLKVDSLLDRLAGRYETYHGTMRADVVRKGGLLYLEIKGRYTGISVPLVPEKLGEEEAVFYVPQLTVKIPAIFRIKEDRVELLYERYKFRRVGPL